MAVCCGRFGMSVQSFWQSSPADIYHYIKQARKKEEGELQRAYEIARWQSRFVLMPHAGKKTIRLQDLGVFPWEEQKIAGPPTPEQIAKLDKHDKRYGTPTVEKIKQKRKRNKVVKLSDLANGNRRK